MSSHPSPHPDLAGYLLGALSASEAEAYAEHLSGCPACRAETAALEPTARAGALAAPPFEVPEGLAERVFAAVDAAAAAPQAPPVATDERPHARRPLQWRPRLAIGGLALAAAAVVAVVLALGARDDDRQRLQLIAADGTPVQVSAAVQVTPVGREVELEIERLDDPRPGGLYELWFVAPGDTPAQPRRVSAGTFHPDEQGRGSVKLVAAAEPDRYPRLSVTLEPADGNPRRTGPEVLRPE